MEITCNIAFSDGSYISVDGFDKIYFYNEIPLVETTYTGYSLQKDKDVYYRALNDLATHAFIGIKRNDNDNRLDYAGKAYAFKNYYPEQNDIIEENEILFLQTNTITTIVVH